MFALKSIKMGAVFGFIFKYWLAVTGDGSAYQVAQKKPMKSRFIARPIKGKSGAVWFALSDF
jgi:cytochrome d ubiquinol oxidase subunit I